MARLIDLHPIVDCPPAFWRAFLFQVNSMHKATYR